MEKLRAQWVVKVLIVIVFSSILLRCVSSVNITVGGKEGWDLLSNIQAWSSSTTTFNIGDDLVFRYTPLHDVVEVNKLGYDTCTIMNALATYDNVNGETVIHLSEAGTRYFVCGRMNHCSLGLKLQVQVLTNNSTGDDQDQTPGGDGGGDGGAPPPGSRTPPASQLGSPPPPPPLGDDQPPPADQPVPCDCSDAGEHRGMVPLITLVITFTVVSSCFFTV